MRRLTPILALSLLAVAMCVGGCFDPPRPKCAFLCGEQSECPADYSCGTDNRCHLLRDDGTLEACEDSFPDAALPVDARGSIDGAGATADAAPPVDAAAPDAAPAADAAAPDAAAPDAAAPDATP